MYQQIMEKNAKKIKVKRYYRGKVTKCTYMYKEKSWSKKDIVAERDKNNCTRAKLTLIMGLLFVSSLAMSDLIILVSGSNIEGG